MEYTRGRSRRRKTEEEETFLRHNVGPELVDRRAKALALSVPPVRNVNERDL